MKEREKRLLDIPTEEELAENTAPDWMEEGRGSGRSGESGNPRRASFRQLVQIFFDTFLVRNIVLVKMIGLCPIIGAATRLTYGVTLTVCAGVALIPSALLMSLVGSRLKPAARAPLYTLLASLLLVGAAYVVDAYISPELYAALYLYLPLMAVNTLVTYRAGGFAVTRGPFAALSDALGSTLGFGIVICLVSAARELLAYGSLWDVPLMEPLLPAAASPFAALFILALLAALLQFLRSLLRRFVEGEVNPADV